MYSVRDGLVDIPSYLFSVRSIFIPILVAKLQTVWSGRQWVGWSLKEVVLNSNALCVSVTPSFSIQPQSLLPQDLIVRVAMAFLFYDAFLAYFFAPASVSCVLGLLQPRSS